MGAPPYQEVLDLAQERALILGLDLEAPVLSLNKQDVVTDRL